MLYYYINEVFFFKNNPQQFGGAHSRMTRTRTHILFLYQARLVLRLMVLAAVVVLYFAWDQAFDAARSGFFQGLSPMHLLWGLWMVDMIFQLFPSRNMLAMGCQKMFPSHAKPSGETPTAEAWAAWRRENRRGACTVALSWLGLSAGVAALRFSGLMGVRGLVLLSTVFYVCDLICVLFWCPFQKLMMRNRCCTTCRIFNWDHVMMFTPMAFLGSFFAASLFAMALVVLLVWEIQYARHPELFWDRTNAALRCANCTDRLCAVKRAFHKRAREVGSQAAAAAGAVSAVAADAVSAAAAGVASTADAMADKAAEMVESSAGAMAGAAQAVTSRNPTPHHSA